MPKYKYIGKNTAGVYYKGMIDAATREAAVGILLKESIVPMKITQLTIFGVLWIFIKKCFARLSPPEPNHLVVFAQEMSALLKAGVQIRVGLEQIMAGTKNTYLRYVFESVIEKLDKGF